jgi:hypothetical protein
MKNMAHKMQDKFFWEDSKLCRNNSDLSKKQMRSTPPLVYQLSLITLKQKQTTIEKCTNHFITLH